MAAGSLVATTKVEPIGVVSFIVVGFLDFFVLVFVLVEVFFGAAESCSGVQYNVGPERVWLFFSFLVWFLVFLVLVYYFVVVLTSILNRFLYKKALQRRDSIYTVCLFHVVSYLSYFVQFSYSIY